MKAYEGVFVKADGSKRTMRFCKVSEIPKLFLESKVVNGGSKVRNYGDGRELVWDIDKMNFRIFNYNSLVGSLKTIEFDENKLI